jgi:hypothetical protein
MHFITGTSSGVKIPKIFLTGRFEPGPVNANGLEPSKSLAKSSLLPEAGSDLQRCQSLVRQNESRQRHPGTE